MFNISFPSKLRRCWMWLGKRKKKVFFSSLVFLFLLIVPKNVHAMGIGDSTLAILILVGPFLFELLAYGLAKVGALFADLILSRVVIYTATHPITKDDVFVAGWISVRNLANMLMVVALIAIAMAIIMKLRDVEAKRLLLPLVIVALLINFSNVFVGIVIDTSDRVMAALIGPASNNAAATVSAVGEIGNRILRNEFSHMLGRDTSSGLPPFAGLATAVATAGIVQISDDSWGVFWGAVLPVAVAYVQFGFIYIAISIAYFLLAILLVARYALLALLFVLSPLAFVFRVLPLPDSKRLWTSWWEHFIKWSFIGVGICFSLKLAMDMLFALHGIPEPGPVAGLEGQASEIMFRLAVVIMILLIGIKITMKSSAMGAQAVMGWGTAIMSGGAGFALGISKKLASTSGLTGLGQRATNAVRDTVSDRFSRAGEAVGILDPGTTNFRKQQREQERLKQGQSAEKIGAADPSQRESVAIGTAITAQQKTNKLNAIKIMAEKGELKNLNPSDLDDVVAYGVSNGLAPDIFTKVNPQLARFNQGKIKELIRTKGITQAQAEKQVVADAYRKQDVSAIREMTTDAFTMQFIENTTAKRIEKAGEDLAADKKKALRDLLPQIQQELNLLVPKLRAGNATPEEITRAQDLLAKHRKISALV